MPFTGFEAMGGAGAAGGTGGGFSWGSLFSNPLVLQMMASMGASLDPEGPAGAIGGVTNQWIRSQSQMKMMQKLLGGGAKITMDKDKTNITGDGSLLDNLSMDLGGQDRGPSHAQDLQLSQTRQVNPFVSSQPGTNLADLAGLRGEDITQAMQLMLGQRSIDRKTTADIYDAMYKMRMADIAGRPRPDPLSKPFPVPVSGKQMTTRQWNALPDSVKAYNAYVFQQKQQDPKAEIMSEREWKQSVKPNVQLEYLRGLDDELMGKAMKLKGASRAEKTPGLLSYGQARRSVESFYGKESPTGQFFIPPELELSKAYALERFDAYSSAGESPGAAANKAFRDTQVYQAKSERMSDILRSLGRESEIPAMLRSLRRYK